MPIEPVAGEHQARHLSSALPVLVTLVSGMLSAVQSRANGTLSQVTGNSVVTSIWSFGSGWLLLTAALALPGPRDALRTAYAAWRAGHLRAWQFLGGLNGALFVVAQAYAVPRAGVALFLICVVAGQTLSGLAVDRSGVGPGGVKPVSGARVVAASVAMVGVLLAVGQRVSGGGTDLVLPALASLAVGAGLALQTAINGRVNAASGNIWTTTWINFTWGMVLLFALAAGSAVTGAPPAAASWAAPWWSFTGGVLGIGFVAIGAAVVRRIGVLLVMLVTLTGQLTGALALDLLTASTRGQVTVWTVAGVLVTFAAAVGAALATRMPSMRRDRP